MTPRDRDTVFTYHPPTYAQRVKYERLRALAREFDAEVGMLTPQSREQSLAFTKIEEAVFWANAAIARNE